MGLFFTTYELPDCLGFFELPGSLFLELNLGLGKKCTFLETFWKKFNNFKVSQ